MTKEIAVNDPVRSLFNMSEKDYIKFIHESLSKEFNYLTKLFNQNKNKEIVGISFYNSLASQPKRKAMYMSFLERQEDQNPKCWKNAMRFMREMQIKAEFQTL